MLFNSFQIKHLWWRWTFYVLFWLYWISITVVIWLDLFETYCVFSGMPFLSRTFNLDGSHLFPIHQLKIIFVNILSLKNSFVFWHFYFLKRFNLLFMLLLSKRLWILCFLFFLRFFIIITNEGSHFEIFSHKLNYCLPTFSHSNNLFWVIDFTKLLMRHWWLRRRMLIDPRTRVDTRYISLLLVKSVKTILDEL